ncbi:MAG: DMT family transporter [Bacteroidales bacterium]|nr:DMT family transporter [Bacteroidales bacterium]
MLILLGLTWGSSFILMKKGLLVYSSSEVGALRIVISFLFLLPFALARLKNIKPRTLLILLLAGILGNGAPAFLFAKAQTVIDSSVAGILNSLTPLFTVLVGIIAFKLKLRWFNFLGVAIGMAGAMGLLAVSGSGEFSFKFSYAIYVIIATLLYAINVNIIKTYLKDVDSIGIVALSFMLIGLPVLIYLFTFTDFTLKLSNHPQALTGLGYVAILAIGGTALALMLFNKLLKMTDPVFASSVTYLIPIIAVLWGFLDGEKLGWSYLLWVLLVLTGIILVSAKHPSRLPIIGVLIRKTKNYTNRFGI